MFVVGVIGVQHPLGIITADNSKVWVAIDRLNQENPLMKIKRRIDLVDKQVDGQTAEGACVGVCCHPRFALTAFHDGLSRGKESRSATI